MTGGSRASQRRERHRHSTALLVASWVVDWLFIVGTAIGGFYLGNRTPNKRPFQLENPDISFPFTVHETVSSRNLVIATIVVPIAIILVVSFLAVPGCTVPAGTPRSLIWRRKLWELYSSLLGFALSMASQWFIVNGLKNICGKPRPDLLARCQPNIQHVAQYVVGGIANITSNGQLVSADICTNPDISISNDGFRSYPSGHSSSAAAGLGHIALYLAFKFRVVFPSAIVMPSTEASRFSAFPSRLRASASRDNAFELGDVAQSARQHQDARRRAVPNDDPGGDLTVVGQTYTILPTRRADAAPPLYLLVTVLLPLAGSVFIAASRWFDFRHHGFDIFFGYAIGATTAILSFRLYHLPLTHGAGWAWGPRSWEKAFWAGVGSYSWAVPWHRRAFHTSDEEEDCGVAATHSSGCPRSLGLQHSSMP